MFYFYVVNKEIEVKEVSLILYGRKDIELGFEFRFFDIKFLVICIFF